MCVMSMVHDHYEPKIPEMEEFVVPNIWTTTKHKITLNPATVDLVEFTALIAEFRKLIEAAKLIDEKTGQPDCVDPLKAKLEDRINELEKLIASPPEFVIVKGGNIEPGRYKVIDGKLYKEVE
jgi:hypothetical protein